MNNRFKRYLLDVFETVYPNKCMSCGRIIEENRRLCPLCERYFEKIDSSNRCRVCGLERQYCCCKRVAYHFESIIAPFYNMGLARQAFYAYKLGSKEHYCQFFAESMLKAIKKEYANLSFDAVVCVPMSRQRKTKYGFNPSEQLARYIAKALNVPFIPDALISRKRKSSQHTLTRISRFERIRNAFTVPHRLELKRVLLIDDIMSTGATVDECARQLMYGGVEYVNCATALITHRKSADFSKYTLYVLKKAGIKLKIITENGEKKWLQK